MTARDEKYAAEREAADKKTMKRWQDAFRNLPADKFAAEVVRLSNPRTVGSRKYWSHRLDLRKAQTGA